MKIAGKIESNLKCYTTKQEKARKSELRGEFLKGTQREPNKTERR